MQDIIDEVNEFLSNHTDQVQERFLFQSRPSEAALKDAPLILMIGNHSSGKSTFINFFTQQQVQLTGMAPTDDDFSILRYGPVEKERTGSSLVSNPAFGFEGLNQFGPKFLSHLKMKTIPNERLARVNLVDTPGMIDSADAEAMRQYDFKGAVRWFAERADLIMLFFDPERPGTTAETLEVYTHALSDFDHKLLVIFNKVDQFQRISDFARCYGNLCWNLGKVMRTKDLPQIYTTFVPRVESQPSPLPLREFEETLALLIKKMENTSLQRVDNILTDVSVYLDRLLLHVEILDGVYRWKRRVQLRLAMVGAVVGGWFGFKSFEGQETWDLYGAGGGALIGGLIMVLGVAQLLYWLKTRQFTGQPDQVFERYSTDKRVHSERQEYLKAQWAQMSKVTTQTLSNIGISDLPKIKKRELKAIQDWRERRLPELRALVHERESLQLQNSADGIEELNFRPEDDVIVSGPSPVRSNISQTTEVSIESPAGAPVDESIEPSVDQRPALFDQDFNLEPQIEELGDDLISISPEEVDALFEQDLR